jgi:5-methylcytosine-specific restriction endonuclease McrA
VYRRNPPRHHKSPARYDARLKKRLDRAERDHSSYVDGGCSCGRLIRTEAGWRDHARAMRKCLERPAKHAKPSALVGAVAKWTTARDASPKAMEYRLRLLRQWADVSVVSIRSPEATREAYLRMRRSASLGTCWCCVTYDLLITHHVVQIQNGGQNSEDNLVRICETCHALVHPWLGRDIGRPMWSSHREYDAVPHYQPAPAPVVDTRPKMLAPRLVKAGLRK